MTEVATTVETESTEAVEYTARQNRKYAQRKLSQAQNNLYGRSGLTASDKLQRLAEAHDAALKAVAALDKAIAQTASEYMDAAKVEENDGQIEVLEYVSDEVAQANS